MLDFTKIDTQIKAYLLGFIAADGCVTDYTMSISLSHKDHSHLVTLAKAFKCGRTPTVRETTYKSKTGETKNYTESVLALHNKRLCDQLKQHGLIPRKSLSLKPPTRLPPTLLTHFIRGYLDGDGHVGFPEPKRPSSFNVQIAGTQWMTEWIAGHFRTIYPNEVEVHKDNYCNCYRLRYGGNTAQSFCKWVYHAATIYLKRKYQIAQPFCEDKIIFPREQGWLLNEEYLLLEHMDLPVAVLAELFPNKTARAIYNKRYYMRLQKRVP